MQVERSVKRAGAVNTNEGHTQTAMSTENTTVNGAVKVEEAIAATTPPTEDEAARRKAATIVLLQKRNKAATNAKWTKEQLYLNAVAERDAYKSAGSKDPAKLAELEAEVVKTKATWDEGIALHKQTKADIDAFRANGTVPDGVDLSEAAIANGAARVNGKVTKVQGGATADLATLNSVLTRLQGTRFWTEGVRDSLVAALGGEALSKFYQPEPFTAEEQTIIDQYKVLDGLAIPEEVRAGLRAALKPMPTRDAVVTTEEVPQWGTIPVAAPKAEETPAVEEPAAPPTEAAAIIAQHQAERDLAEAAEKAEGPVAEAVRKAVARKH